MDQLKSIEDFYSQKDPDMDEDLEDFVSKLKDRKRKRIYCLHDIASLMIRYDLKNDGCVHLLQDHQFERLH